MLIGLKKQLGYWKIAAITLPFIALLILLLTDFIDPVYHDEIYCVALIFVGIASVTFWVWTMYNMIRLISYMTIAESNYNEIKRDLAETKALLKQEGQNARNRERRKS